MRRRSRRSRRRNESGMPRISLAWFRRWSWTDAAQRTERGRICPVCSDKGESPDIGQTVECLHIRVGQQDFSLYLIPVSSALWTEVAGWNGRKREETRKQEGRGGERQYDRSRARLKGKSKGSNDCDWNKYR